MGRPPCCDKVGIKKGPWTPEEDIILVSYIQEHGPGNWRSVPTNTGLSRCSKSCRLRWTNYLRPGIKRGNFTPHEEGMIIHLQALLGNKWAAIASYLPQRTDNDIKNYWNTHLKKKLKKLQAATLDPHHLASSESSTNNTTTQYLSKSFNEISLDSNNHGSSSSSSSILRQQQTQSQSSTYASSTENISRLLEGWMRSSPKQPLKEGTTTTTTTTTTTQEEDDQQKHFENNNNRVVPPSLNLDHKIVTKDEEQEGGDMGVSHNNEEFDSILSFENVNNNGANWDKSTCDSMPHQKCSSQLGVIGFSHGDKDHDGVEKNNNAPPLSFLEKWLLDENVGQVEEMMELSPMF